MTLVMAHDQDSDDAEDDRRLRLGLPLTAPVEPPPPDDALRREAGTEELPPSRPWNVVASFMLPGQGLVRLGRSRLGWAVFAFPYLGVLPCLLSPWVIPVWMLLVTATHLLPLFVRAGTTLPMGTFWRQALLRFGLMIVLALVVRQSFVEAFKIPAGSMLPTLEVGDHIMVNKLAYGLRVPFTGTVLGVSTPGRGDLIVFIYPREPEKDFIKRVVAIAGDRVEVKDNQLTVNGQAVPHEKQAGECRFEDFDERLGHWDEKRCVRYRERLGAHSYDVVDAIDEYPKDFPGPGDESPYVVPAGHVFVMGDNRNNSHDSRFWGPVPLENIKGEALYVWWSSGPHGTRSERIGRNLE